jgi:uncharacterized protein YndB with AHSA1/START domain
VSERSIVHSTFTLKRTYPAPISQVFQAWADPKIKVRWFASNSADYRMDFRPGGLERNGVLHDGKKITWESLYREIVPGERVVYTSVLSEDEVVATLSLTTVEFVLDGEGTGLVLVAAAPTSTAASNRPGASKEQATGSTLLAGIWSKRRHEHAVGGRPPPQSLTIQHPPRASLKGDHLHVHCSRPQLLGFA